MRKNGLFGLFLLLAVSVTAQNTDIRAAIDVAADKIEPRTIAWRRDFHEHPELGNREFRTSKIIADHLRSLGLEVHEAVGKATYNGQEVGVMHACGHDSHIAIMMSVAEILAGMKQQLHGTVKFIFQPAEEGPPNGEEGGAAVMIKEGVLDNSVCVVQGGIRPNIIPEEVEMTGTIRTLDTAMQSEIHQRMRRTVTKIAESAGATADITIFRPR